MGAFPLPYAPVIPRFAQDDTERGAGQNGNCDEKGQYGSVSRSCSYWTRCWA